MLILTLCFDSTGIFETRFACDREATPGHVIRG
jgi:hypothetical protein